MKKGRFVFLLFFLFVSLVSSQTGSNLTIIYTNIAPIQSSLIPNQTWSMNTNLTDSIDLDDYFTDEDTIYYNSSSVENITILINSTTNKVSFYPDLNFYGVRNIVFYARDYELTRNSTPVLLNVTPDTIPPYSSNPSKNKNKIYQNTVVTFRTDWYDNLGLKEYFFSIKQQGGWVNQSSISFAGISNSSNYSIQISAPGGTTVFWRFFAYDSPGNQNASEISNFTVSSSSIPSTPPSTNNADEDTFSSTNDEETLSKNTTLTSINNISVSPLNGFNLDILEGSSRTISIKITNTGNAQQTLSISINGLEDFTITISEEVFTLSPGESKVIVIDIVPKENLSPDIYYGKIKISSPYLGQEIPLVIVYNKLITELNLSVDIEDKYKRLSPGEDIFGNITITHLKDVKEKNLFLYYAITDKTGNIYDSKTEQFILNTTTISLEKSLNIPLDTSFGEYLFFARIVSEEGVVIGANSFEVAERFNAATFIKSNYIIISIIVLVFVLTIFMYKEQSNRKKLRLLNLYLSITELNKLVKAEKYDDAIDIYVKIKRYYGESINKEVLENKDLLKKELVSFSESLKSKVIDKIGLNDKIETKVEEKPKEEKEIKKEEKNKDDKNENK